MTETMTTNDDAVWEIYTESWKQPDVEEKRSRFAQSLAPNCTYTDPLVVAHGWDEIEQYMHDFHTQAPGAHFVTTWFNRHHDRSASRWDMVAGDGTKLGEGVSYAVYGDDGKLTSMTGFFDADAQ